MVITKTINGTSYKIKVDNTGHFFTEVLFSEFAKKEVVSAASLNALVRKINEKDMIDLCHYTNLQPLEAISNMKKGAKYFKFKT